MLAMEALTGTIKLSAETKVRIAGAKRVGNCPGNTDPTRTEMTPEEGVEVAMQGGLGAVHCGERAAVAAGEQLKINVFAK